MTTNTRRCWPSVRPSPQRNASASSSRMPRIVYAFAAFIAASVMVSAQAPAFQLPMEPPRDFGTSITASMEGWFENPDGTKTFIVGYLNRNAKMEIDVPIGPNNSIEPGGPDYGQ